MKKLFVTAAMAVTALFAANVLAQPIAYHYVKSSLRTNDPRYTCVNDVCTKPDGQDSFGGNGTLNATIDWDKLTYNSRPLYDFGNSFYGFSKTSLNNKLLKLSSDTVIVYENTGSLGTMMYTLSSK